MTTPQPKTVVPTEDVERIAAGLTKAQRAAVLALEEGSYRTATQIGAAGATMAALLDFWRSKRDIQPPLSLVTRDYTDWPRLAWTYALTPLGLAVRQHLIEKAKA